METYASMNSGTSEADEDSKVDGGPVGTKRWTVSAGLVAGKREDGLEGVFLKGYRDCGIHLGDGGVLIYLIYYQLKDDREE